MNSIMIRGLKSNGTKTYPKRDLYDIKRIETDANSALFILGVRKLVLILNICLLLWDHDDGVALGLVAND